MSGAQEWRPGQDTQAVATARIQGQDPDKIHCPTWGIIGNLGDSICYAGVPAKVDAIQAELGRRITGADLPVRLIAPDYAGGISDGQRNGSPEMRYSLIGRETTNDGVCLHLEGSDVRGVIAVVACDKPPVGTLAAILERNVPAVIMSDGSIRPGVDSRTGEPIDIISCFQAAAESLAERRRLALEGSPGHGSCGGMFTYNTMQSFIATCGMEPLHMVSPASEDRRRVDRVSRPAGRCAAGAVRARDHAARHRHRQPRSAMPRSSRSRWEGQPTSSCMRRSWPVRPASTSGARS